MLRFCKGHEESYHTLPQMLRGFYGFLAVVSALKIEHFI